MFDLGLSANELLAIIAFVLLFSGSRSVKQDIIDAHKEIEKQKQWEKQRWNY